MNNMSLFVEFPFLEIMLCIYLCFWQLLDGLLFFFNFRFVSKYWFRLARAVSSTTIAITNYVFCGCGIGLFVRENGNDKYIPSFVLLSIHIKRLYCVHKTLIDYVCVWVASECRKWALSSPLQRWLLRTRCYWGSERYSHIQLYIANKTDYMGEMGEGIFYWGKTVATAGMWNTFVQMWKIIWFHFPFIFILIKKSLFIKSHVLFNLFVYFDDRRDENLFSLEVKFFCYFALELFFTSSNHCRNFLISLFSSHENYSHYT